MHRLAAETLLRRLRQLRHWAPVVIEGTDVEGVHQMRIASRRLRSAMAAFRRCLPRDHRKRWRSRIRRITRLLGPARDLDVQIEFVQSILATHVGTEAAAGLEFLLHRLQAERADLQPGLVKGIERLQSHGTLRQIRKAMGTLRQTTRKHWSGSWTDSSADVARAQAGAHALRRAREMISWESSLLNPADVHRHHEMRKAAKRLRYVLEIFDPLWGGRLEPAVEWVHDFQRLLGRLHDCDVWIERLPVLATAAEADGHVEEATGLRFLLDDRRQARQLLWNQFLDTYRAAQGRGFWEHLYRVLHSQPGRPENRP